VAVTESGGELVIEVQDDGGGFDPDLANDGFGLSGIRERVTLAGGTLSIDSGEQGTLLRACLPTLRRPELGRSGAQQAAS
jgi:signal transduction histidine kinase